MRRVFTSLFCGLAGLAVLTWLVVALCRLGHPFELEWQEGGILQHMQRLMAGEAIYTAPSLDFVPFPYPPLYPLVGALFTPLCGASFSALRLVSVLATLATLALLMRLASLGAARESGALPGLLAAGCYAACFPLAGAWFDVARVDALWLALMLGGATCLRAAPAVRSSGRHGAGAGALLFLALCTKQTALPLALLLALPAFQRGRRCGRAYLLTLLLPGLLALVAGHLLTAGWSTRHLFLLPAAHPFSAELALSFWTVDLLPNLPVALGLSIALLLAGARIKGERRDLFLPALLSGLTLTSWLSRAHVGGWDNVLMPVCAALALGLAGAVERLLPGVGRRAASRQARFGAALLALLVCGQFLILFRDPRPQIPTAQAQLAGEAFVTELRHARGEVLVPYHGYLAARGGSPMGAHAMGLIDLMRGADPTAAEPLLRALETDLARRRWSAIYLDEPWDLPALEANYRRDPRFVPPHELSPVTGEPTFPRHRYLPR